MRTTICFLVICTMLAGGRVHAQQMNVTTAHADLSHASFVVITDEGETMTPEIIDSLFYSVAQGVEFNVNSSRLNSSSQFLVTWEALLPELRSQKLHLRQLFIRGAASPDGSYAVNRRLGQERAQTLIDYITETLAPNDTTLRSSFDARNVTEDYGYLVQLLRENEDPDYYAVWQVYDDCGGDELCCKEALRSLDHGLLWRRLQEKYFPRLRAARIVLWMVRPREPELVRPVVPVDIPVIVDSMSVMPFAGQQQYSMVHRHQWGLRTNMLRDLFCMPGIGFTPGVDVQMEYYPIYGHYTYNGGVTWTDYHRCRDHRFFQIRDVQLSVRRYFQGKGRFRGPYAAAYVHGFMYGIGMSATKGWQGEGLGAGLDMGWVIRLTRRGNLRMEFNVSVGFLASRYDPYVWGNPITGAETGKYYYDYTGYEENFRRRNHLFTWLGPTNAGISLTYDVKYRRRKTLVRGGDTW